MKPFSAILFASACAALIAFSAPAFADDFMDACIAGANGGTDQAQTCSWISSKLPASSRADATAALRKSTQSMQENAMPLDPSSLPPNLMRGLQAYVLAQADCL